MELSRPVSSRQHALAKRTLPTAGATPEKCLLVIADVENVIGV
jgi:hypothetical protein